MANLTLPGNRMYILSKPVMTSTIWKARNHGEGGGKYKTKNVFLCQYFFLNFILSYRMSNLSFGLFESLLIFTQADSLWTQFQFLCFRKTNPVCSLPFPGECVECGSSELNDEFFLCWGNSHYESCDPSAIVRVQFAWECCWTCWTSACVHLSIALVYASADVTLLPGVKENLECAWI
jgi:hypothetical protein